MNVKQLFGLLFLLAVYPAAAQQTSLADALLGHWTGVLEYRDYSEPATSTKRVQLPTWLDVSTQPEGLRFHYVYDDGPNKIVDERPTVVIDAEKALWKVLEPDHPASSYKIDGLASLKNGRGVLVLTGSGEDNSKPSEIRETVTVRRNLLTILEEVRPAGGAAEYAFRHRYVFTRAEPPVVTAPR